MDRADLLDVLAVRVRAVPGPRRLVAVDGVDGAGKTVLASALVARLVSSGTPAWRVSLDGFHRPRVERYRQGRDSPSGFFEDTYDLVAFGAAVVEPLASGGSRRVRTAAFDHRTDEPVDGEVVAVPAGGVVVVDGLFLHRPELVGVWDLSVLLEVPFAETFRRMSVRDGCPPDPADPANRRYVEGQRLYLERCAPRTCADVVVDNTDVDAPVIVRG